MMVRLEQREKRIGAPDARPRRAQLLWGHTERTLDRHGGVGRPRARTHPPILLRCEGNAFDMHSCARIESHGGEKLEEMVVGDREDQES